MISFHNTTESLTVRSSVELSKVTFTLQQDKLRTIEYTSKDKVDYALDTTNNAAYIAEFTPKAS